MTNQELQETLIAKCNVLNLKTQAFENLKSIISQELENDYNFLCGFDRSEVNARFESFQYLISERYPDFVIRTTFGLHVANGSMVDNNDLDRIGYYSLDTDLIGEAQDDWFVIEKEKYIKDVNIIAHFQHLNSKLPLNYLELDQLQYELVTNISMIGMLFVSKEFEGAGNFVQRCYAYLGNTNVTLIDKEYLKAIKWFLKIMKNYLLSNSLVSAELRDNLQK